MMTHLAVRTKLTLWYTGITCITFLAVGVAIYSMVWTSVQRNADRELSLRLEGIERYLQNANPDLTIDQLSHELRERGGVRINGDPFQIMDQDGRWLYRPPSMLPLNLSAAPAAAKNDGRQRFSTLEIEGRRMRVLSAAFAVRDRRYSVQIVSNITAIYNILRRALWLAFTTAPALLFLAGAGGYWLSGRAMRPVCRITQTAKNIGERDLAARLTVPPAKDELRELSITLNEMLGRLETAFQRVTQFTADASHELRTPIAVIRTTAEFILQKERTIPEYQQFVGQILIESEATTEMIENLLMLARYESFTVKRVAEYIDLRTVVSEVARSLMPMADKQDVLLSAEAVDAPAVAKIALADARKLVVILLDNAIKYTRPGGKISVSVGCEVAGAFLQVKDSGVGIDAAELPKIFERFYRVDKGRSAGAGGVGLGLSIAQEIAQQNSATISVISEPDCGTTCRVCFPVADALGEGDLHATEARPSILEV